MELRFALFFISLALFHSNDVGEASSDDKYKRTVGRKAHKWTPDEEMGLIFLDVSTDTGERNHFRRISEGWCKEYPQSDVSYNALRRKILRLREESLDEGGKKNFKWNAELEQELVDVYHTTRPYVKDANVSLDEEWKTQHPDFQATGGYLLWRIKRLFGKYRYLRYRIPGSSKASSLVEDTAGRVQHRWTEYEKARLLHFQKLTSTGGRTQLDKIRSLWHEEFPKSYVTDHALINTLRRLRRASRKEGERKKYLIWTPEDEKMLLYTYLNTYPHRKGATVSFGEVWKQRQEGFSGDEKYLLTRARKLLRDNKYPEYSALGSQAGPSRVKSQKRNKSLPKMKSLKGILDGRKDPKSGKQFGKAPIVYSSEESASFSPPMTSEDSE